MEKKKTLVLGASQNPARYSYLALKSLNAKNHPVVAIGKRQGKVDNIEIDAVQKPINDLSRGCTAEDIADLTAITVCETQESEYDFTSLS